MKNILSTIKIDEFSASYFVVNLVKETSKQPAINLLSINGTFAIVVHRVIKFKTVAVTPSAIIDIVFNTDADQLFKLIKRSLPIIRITLCRNVAYVVTFTFDNGILSLF